MTCPACNRIERIRRHEDTSFIVELAESFVVLGDQQFYRGWCVLLLKDHHEHLAQLPFNRQTRLWQDVSRVAIAITRLLNPKRVNYENLGNQLNHIHWHVIPRYANDPEPTQPIWNQIKALPADSMSELDRQTLIAQLRTQLQLPV